MIVITDPHCTNYHQWEHPEQPERILGTIAHLRKQKKLSITWAEPSIPTEAIILRAHTLNLVASLTQGVDFDADTPAYPGIGEHAWRSVGGALQALDYAMKEQTAFSLMRPPGHHAERARAMGFCYLNSIAIAALEAVARGMSRMAVYDFDVHHGNGTEDILLGNPACRFYSIHQFPCYPGTGASSKDNVYNYPVRPQMPRSEYRDILRRAIDHLASWKPEIIAVSAGFDAYRGDPLSQEILEAEDFHDLGCWLKDLKIPCFAILEGGYSTQLPELILSFLQGLEEKTTS